MAEMIMGLFSDSKRAGEAVAELKEKGYTQEISVLAQDEKYEDGEMHEVKQDVSTGTAVGAATGALTGALAAIFSGITAITLPGVGLLVGGPLAALLGVTGGAAGALTGGLVGALVDLGINEPAAEMYEARIKKGDVLVGVTADDDRTASVRSILSDYGATDILTVQR